MSDTLVDAESADSEKNVWLWRELMCWTLDTMVAFYVNAPYNHERNEDLDVPHLWLDL
ncbi:hypothetical protein NBRC116584_13360 [Hydrogenophaga sp. 5NK40-0174]